MNKSRIYATSSIMLSFSGIALMSTEKTLGVAIMVIGLVPTIIFLTKAKREEKHPGSKSNQDKIPRQEKKSILQTITEHLKEKPVTDEEIRQLRLEAEKYRLKADIAKSKAAISESKNWSSRL